MSLGGGQDWVREAACSLSQGPFWSFPASDLPPRKLVRHAEPTLRASQSGFDKSSYLSFAG